MSAGYTAFMALMMGALLTMVWAWIATVRFFHRNKPPEHSQFNPLHGIALWARLVTTDAFGEAAEPARRRIIRTYLLAGALFASAVLIIAVLPVAPN